MFQLHVVQAAHGDSLLLTFGHTAVPRHILIDGGPNTTYTKHLKEILTQVREAGSRLDCVVLSHVDDDHINGLLDLFDDMVGQRARGSEETVEIAGIWFNTFEEQISEPVTATMATAVDDTGVLRSGMEALDLPLHSIRQGSQLTHFANELAIAVNADFKPHRLVCVENAPDPIVFDNLQLRIVGPTLDNLAALQAEWEAWLDTHARKQREGEPVIEMAPDEAPPNLSSIMLLATAHDKTVLLTGDGRSDHLLDGLAQANCLSPTGTLHVDVLKLPHHGSVRNVTPQFFRQITADTYLICANGKHDNPDLQTLIWLVEAACEQGRTFTIVATTYTPSLAEIIGRYDPALTGYKLVILPPEQHALTIPLDRSNGEDA